MTTKIFGVLTTPTKYFTVLPGKFFLQQQEKIFYWLTTPYFSTLSLLTCSWLDCNPFQYLPKYLGTSKVPRLYLAIREQKQILTSSALLNGITYHLIGYLLLTQFILFPLVAKIHRFFMVSM